jgi:glyoxylase-like metal-dependent hydrolase (beta-lactamase superfamily II)
MLLKDLGKAGLAIMVLGVGACSEEDADNLTTTASRSNPTTTDDVTVTTQDVTVTTGAPTSSTQGPIPSGWQRANLGFVSAYILYRNGEAAVIDTGVSGSETAIEGALREVGLEWGAVGHIIITHKHPDHQGSLAGLLARADDAAWYAGTEDISAITAPTEGMAVGDGDSVFDLKIIETPGHTPGHVSVLDAAAEVMVTGDALNGTDGGVTGANPEFSQDMNLANASVAKLASFDYEVALFGHSEPILSGASRAVGELAATLG